MLQPSVSPSVSGESQHLFTTVAFLVVPFKVVADDGGVWSAMYCLLTVVHDSCPHSW